MVDTKYNIQELEELERIDKLREIVVKMKEECN